MRFLTAVAAFGVAMGFAVPAAACDKDQSAKAEQVKQQTAQTTSHSTKSDQNTSKPHGG
jgi:hypothetical protein